MPLKHKYTQATYQASVGITLRFPRLPLACPLYTQGTYVQRGLRQPMRRAPRGLVWCPRVPTLAPVRCGRSRVWHARAPGWASAAQVPGKCISRTIITSTLHTAALRICHPQGPLPQVFAPDRLQICKMPKALLTLLVACLAAVASGVLIGASGTPWGPLPGVVDRFDEKAAGDNPG